MLVLKKPYDQFEQRDVISMTNLCGMVEKPGMKILEIGCWLGDSTQILGKFALKNKGEVHVVDTFKGSVATELLDFAKENNVREIFDANMSELKLDSVLKVYQMTSDEALNEFKDEYFDLIFIDGDHRYKQVLKDIDNYLPKVKKGGIISGHDIDARYKDIVWSEDLSMLENNSQKTLSHEWIHVGVSKAVHERFRDYNIFGKTWWVRK